jgi:glycosyltransferase involved in cell wall biosynthesis
MGFWQTRPRPGATVADVGEPTTRGQVAERAKIALVANTAFNIANFRLGLVTAFQDAGHDVVCLTPDEDFWPGQGAVGMIEGAGARYVSVPMDRGGTNPLTDLLLFLRLLRHYRRVRPDLIFHYTVKPVVYGSIVAGLLGIPSASILTGQGSALLAKRSPVAFVTRSLLRFALRRAALVFFLNPADRTDFIERGIVDEDRARLLPGEGIDTAHFVPSGPLPETPTFLMVARLLRDKGVYEYVAAAREVRAKHPEARFLLGGALDKANPSGVGDAELAEWRTAGDIEYLGVVDDPRPWYRKASAVVLPSYREGMSRVLLEAISCGRPVLASNVPGCRELVDDGANGLLFAPRDAAALADAMERFLAMSPETHASLGKHGRKRALAEFDEDIVNQIYLDELPNLLRR